MLDVVLVTCRKLPEPDPDAEPLEQALRGAGLRVGVWAWDDPARDWATARLAVLRSTWDYTLHREAFLAWAAQASDRTRLWNPLEVIEWNSHKRYLIELAKRGFPVTPTALVPRGTATTLPELLAQRAWKDVVVKPAVSAGSYRTFRVTDPGDVDGVRRYRQLVDERDTLVQSYLPSVTTYGERALVWIDGELTHAVRKSPRFDGQDESVSDAVPISPEEAALCKSVLDAVGRPLLYARVDVAPGTVGSGGETGKPVLMELELIEPSLFLVQGPVALQRLVSAIVRQVGQLGD